MGAKPVGAELWASFHAAPSSRQPPLSDSSASRSEAAAAAAADDAAADTGWNNLTALLSGQFCASLSRLARTEVVVEPTLAFHPWDGGVRAVAGGHLRRHGSLPAEAVCTENLTPWIKLLPCRDQAGVGALLRSRPTIFGSNYVSFSTRVRVVRKRTTLGDGGYGIIGRGGVGGEAGGGDGDGDGWVVELTQAITLVLDTPTPEGGTGGAGNGKSGWWMSSLLGLGGKGGAGLRGACAASSPHCVPVVYPASCAVAASSAVHVETHRPYAVEPRSGVDLASPRVHSAVGSRLGRFEFGVGEGPVTLKTWDLTTVKSIGGGGGGGGGRFDLHVSLLDEAPMLGTAAGSTVTEAGSGIVGAGGLLRGRRPLRGAAPEFYAERVVTGSGYHRGGLSIELRRPDDGGEDRPEAGASGEYQRTDVRVRLFQVLPWYVRVFIHTLAVEFDGVAVRVPTSATRSGGASGAAAAVEVGDASTQACGSKRTRDWAVMPLATLRTLTQGFRTDANKCAFL